MIAQLMGLSSISPSDLDQRMRTEPVLVIDVNSEASWLAARVPGARHLDPASFASEDLPGDRTTLMVFYCSNPLCRKAPNAARRAKAMGYGNVHVMSGGINGWRGASLPTEAGAPTNGR